MAAFDTWGLTRNPRSSYSYTLRLVLRLYEAVDDVDDDFPIERMFPRFIIFEEQEAAGSATDQERQLFLPCCLFLAF